MTKAKVEVRDHRGGCHDCGAEWEAKNVVAVAGHHHSRYNHRTWAEVGYVWGWETDPDRPKDEMKPGMMCGSYVGTASGAARHYRAGEPACPECRAAAATRVREWRHRG